MLNTLIESMMQIGVGLFDWALVGVGIYVAVRVGELISDSLDRLIKHTDPKGGQ